MQFLQRETRIGKSKVSKLLTIAGSDRLKAHQDKFAHVNAWTVLYEVAAMPDKEFEKVVAGVSDGQVVTVAAIDRLRGKRKDVPSNFKSLFTVKVDYDSLNLGKISTENFEKIRKTLNALKAEIPYIEILETDVFASSEKKFEQDCKKEFEDIFRETFQRAYIAFLRKNDAPLTVRKVGPIKKYKIKDRADFSRALAEAKSNPIQAFSAIDAEYSEEKLRAEAKTHVLNGRIYKHSEKNKKK